MKVFSIIVIKLKTIMSHDYEKKILQQKIIDRR